MWDVPHHRQCACLDLHPLHPHDLLALEAGVSLITRVDADGVGGPGSTLMTFESGSTVTLQGLTGTFTEEDLFR